MGGYKKEWETMEPKFPIDWYIVSIAFIFHAWMTIPIYFARLI